MNGMIALRTIVYFLVTSLISALLGLAMVLIIHPGNPETKTLLGDGNTEERKVDIVDNFLDLGRNLFPDNLFQASFQTVSIIDLVFHYFSTGTQIVLQNFTKTIKHDQKLGGKSLILMSSTHFAISKTFSLPIFGHV